jgi:hypothetical protein
VDFTANGFHSFGSRPNVGQELTTLSCSLLVEVKAEKIEAISTHIHDPGFGRMECQFQNVHDLLDRLQGSFSVLFCTTDDNEVG